MAKIKTIYFPPTAEGPRSPENQPTPKTTEQPKTEHLDRSKLSDFKEGDSIDWVDDGTKQLFTKPAYGYGEGPFTLSSIKVDPHAPRNLDEFPRLGIFVLFEIETQKGKKFLSADHFKKHVQQELTQK
jgi:hypothetical protein